MAICCLPTWLSPTQGRGKRGIQMQQGCMPEEKAAASGVSLPGHIQKPSGHCPGHPAPVGPVCAEGSDLLTSRGPFQPQPFCDTKTIPSKCSQSKQAHKSILERSLVCLTGPLSNFFFTHPSCLFCALAVKHVFLTQYFSAGQASLALTENCFAKSTANVRS